MCICKHIRLHTRVHIEREGRETAHTKERKSERSTEIQMIIDYNEEWENMYYSVALFSISSIRILF